MEFKLADIVDQYVRANGQRVEEALTALSQEDPYFLAIADDDYPVPVKGLFFEKDRDDRIYISFLSERPSVGSDITCFGLDRLIKEYGPSENFTSFLRSLENPVPDQPGLFGPLTASQGAALTKAIIFLNLAHNSQQKAEKALRASFPAAKDLNPKPAAHRPEDPAVT
ncbi:MAG: hypothetical protein IT558_00515 [Alphaproteobacteria bacterium]|nr:hypothetical protein [Alphaproteobacteria bacterium]